MKVGGAAEVDVVAVREDFECLRRGRGVGRPEEDRV